MLEPFLMLTVLNCFFMFSSTMTTWQHKRHRHSYRSHSSEASKLKPKKSQSHENRRLRSGNECCTGNVIDLVGSKSGMKHRGKSSPRTGKEAKKDKKIKSFGLSKKSRSKEPKAHESKEIKFLEKPTSTEDIRRGATSPSSDAKSTVVMELSTVQKVVQIIDNDRDHNHVRRIPNETVTYTFTPETQRKVEFVVKSKSDDGSRSMERIDRTPHRT